MTINGNSRLRRIMVCCLCLLLLAAAVLAVGAIAASGQAEGRTQINSQRISAASSRSVITVTDERYERFVLQTDVTLTSSGGNTSAGLCAVRGEADGIAQGECDQLAEFALDQSTGLYYSNVEFYGSTNAVDYGVRGTLAEGGQDMSLTLIRDGELFYFIADGALVQIREAGMLASSFGFTIRNGTAVVSGSWSAADADVDAALAQYAAGELTIGKQYANISSYTPVEGGFAVDARCVGYGFDYSMVGWGDWYDGSICVEHELTDITYDPNNDTGGSRWPKIGLVVYNERGFRDYLCLGVASKSDRVETGLANGFSIWWNHTDLTADPDYASTVDLSGGVQMKVVITNTGTTKIYDVYVNGVFAARRVSYAYGDVRLGFACDYAACTIKNISVTETEGAA